MSIWTKTFWQATAERAVSTVAQAGVATIAGTAALHQVDWPLVGSVAGLAGVLSVLKALAVGASGNGPGIGDSEKLTTAAPNPQHARDDNGDGIPDTAPDKEIH